MQTAAVEEMAVVGFEIDRTYELRVACVLERRQIFQMSTETLIFMKDDVKMAQSNAQSEGLTSCKLGVLNELLSI